MLSDQVLFNEWLLGLQPFMNGWACTESSNIKTLQKAIRTTERETLQAVSGAVNQAAHSVQLCSDITPGLTAIRLHRIPMRDEKPASTAECGFFFTTTAVKEEQKVWNLLDQKEDKNLNQSTLSKTNLETVLIICLMSPAFCIPHSGSGGSGFINNAIGLSFTVLLWHALN